MMPTILNKTNRPLRVNLPQGKTLHLGPRMEGQIAPQALDSAGVKKLVDAGELEVLGNDVLADSGNRDTGHAATDTHGHHPNTTVPSRGDR